MKGRSDSISFSFDGEIWKYQGKGGWHFASLPRAISDNIRNNLREIMKPWGSVKIQARIGNTKWETSLFYETKRDCFLIPVKSTIRRKENISTGDIRKIFVLLYLF